MAGHRTRRPDRIGRDVGGRLRFQRSFRSRWLGPEPRSGGRQTVRGWTRPHASAWRCPRLFRPAMMPQADPADHCNSCLHRGVPASRAYRQKLCRELFNKRRRNTKTRPKARWAFIRVSNIRQEWETSKQRVAGSSPAGPTSEILSSRSAAADAQSLFGGLTHSPTAYRAAGPALASKSLARSDFSVFKSPAAAVRRRSHSETIASRLPFISASVLASLC